MSPRQVEKPARAVATLVVRWRNTVYWNSNFAFADPTFFGNVLAEFTK